MKRFGSLLMFLCALSGSTILQAQNGYTATSRTPATYTYTMPEPTAIPELILCVTGLGLLAWRRRPSRS